MIGKVDNMHTNILYIHDVYFTFISMHSPKLFAFDGIIGEQREWWQFLRQHSKSGFEETAVKVALPFRRALSTSEAVGRLEISHHTIQRLLSLHAHWKLMNLQNNRFTIEIMGNFQLHEDYSWKQCERYIRRVRRAQRGRERTNHYMQPTWNPYILYWKKKQRKMISNPNSITLLVEMR